MNRTTRLHQITVTLLTAGLLALSGWGSAASPVQAAAASAAALACGTGDHGLLQDLQRHMAELTAFRLPSRMWSF